MNRFFFFAVTSGVVLALPVLADTRDEVYARMQRCQVIADDHAWLNCTYGAEQPMRAKLGLQPAPDFQQRLVPLPPSASARPAYPAPAYAAPPYPSPANAAPRNTQAALPHRSASFMQVLTGSAPTIAASTIASVQYDTEGGFIVTLDNGQVWYQVNTETGTRARFKVGANVTIKPGAFGSYDFHASDNPRVYKAKPKA